MLGGEPMSDLLSFPNPVNEKAARLVAGTVAIVALVALATGARWLLAPLAYGFVARALTGPTLSPLGRASMWGARRWLGTPRYVPGPPKRFAQAIGAVCTTAGAIATLALGWDTAADVLLAMMVVFATLESVFAFCVGCRLFAALMRLGVIPVEVCEECANISLRYERAAG
jgi:hypothetical protein